MASHPPQIIELARRGAELQLRDLIQEIKYLIDLFPHLRDSFSDDELPVWFIMDRDARRTSKASTGGPRQRRRRLPEAVRKAVGARTKKDWSARRRTKRG